MEGAAQALHAERPDLGKAFSRENLKRLVGLHELRAARPVHPPTFVLNPLLLRSSPAPNRTPTRYGDDERFLP